MVVCREGEESERAFLLPSSEIYVSRNHINLRPTKVENLIIGTLEYLMAESGDSVPTRIFTVEIEAEERPRGISFNSIENMLLDFVTGHKTNQYLAFLIDETNRLIQVLSGGPRWRSYKKLARRIFQSLERLETFHREFGIETLRELLDDVEKYRIVRYGKLQFSQPENAQLTIQKSDELEDVITKKADEPLCREGELATCMYVLLRGSVTVKKGDRVLGVIESPGEAFGELSFFLHQKRTADVLVREPSAFLQITIEKLPAFHATHPLLFYQLGRTLAKRVMNNLKELDETEWISSPSSEALVRKEKDEFLEQLRVFKRLGPPTPLVTALNEIESSIDSYTS